MNTQSTGKITSKSDILNFLKKSGICHDDKVLVHTSLRSTGEIEGGADGLIDAFCEYLYNGLFIVPTHTWDEVVRENPYYDVKTSVPCIGTLPRIAAFRKDAKRSLHPTHSVAVFGKNAGEFIKGEENCASPAPVGSCLSRLYEEGGKILLIGVGHDKNTYLHAVDERLDIKNRLNPDPFVITIKDSEGNLIKSPPFHTHFSKGINGCCSEYYPNYKKAFEYTGAVTYRELGNATVYCCDAVKMTDTVKMLWENTDHDLCSGVQDIPEEYYIRSR
ncbi:MAG: AAC(3) family N-acetyltransferase [Oscillospiraceae bacterium]|nr:AAC(3) family N-acetyltransferase [Oscillospiraceae bacterium]